MSRISARRLRINGTVQGVGFRPFVYVLATDENLNGTVLNDGQGVETVLEGEEASIARFMKRLTTELPPLASIETIVSEEIEPSGFTEFKILESHSNAVSTVIPADAAVCRACLSELTNKNNRRYRYPFINCTHCGPRYTITAHLPYDRPQTSMKDFPMCSDCLEEYTDPLDRRFHAQPNACPVCGPHVTLLDKAGLPINTDDPLAEVMRRIKAGEIAAIKGLGGFHLVCDAKNAQAVSRLRERKKRPSKPFALMVQNTASARRIAEVSEEAQKLLESSAAPIVLLPKKPGADDHLVGIAPNLTHIGLMLPYTPIHWLLFFEAADRSEDPLWHEKPNDLTLVMTSANAGGEPLVISNAEAVRLLEGICDCFLVHKRDILIRCDDSVAQAKDNDVQYIRRARGLVPQAIALPFSGPSVIAAGAWLKNTACLTKGTHAYLTQHIGDLDRVSNDRTLEKAIRHLSEVFEIRPDYIACDLHPDFYSTVLAEKLANEFDVELIAVQHHHAHIAAVMAEHGLKEAVLGLALDGVGLGTDGKSWGGELLKVDPLGFERLKSLSPILLPGGDKCAREGWRMAYALLCQNGLAENAKRLFPFKGASIIERMLASDLPIPESSSLGRIFDTAAALTGVKTHSSYEGEAPVLFQAAGYGTKGRVREDLLEFSESGVNFVPLLLNLTQYSSAAEASADFHETVAFALSRLALAAAEKTKIRKVCLSGGCCLNTRLSRSLRNYLEEGSLSVYEGLRIPPNDGGVSLGQAYAVLMKLHSNNGV